MVVSLHRYILGSLGSALVLLGASLTLAQQPEYYVTAGLQQQPAPYYAPPETMSYEQRLADQEARIAQLEAQLHQQFQQGQVPAPPYYPGPVPAQPVAANLADAAPASDLGACKEVELITKPQMRIFGRLYLDVVNFEDDSPSPVFDGNDRQNEAGFGAARFGFTGCIYENVYGQLEMDYANAVKFKDTYIEAQNLPWVGTLKAGFFKEPINLDDMTSDNHITFMNRSLAIRTFSPSRRWGGMIKNYVAENENASWFMGTFAGNYNDQVGVLAQDAGDWTYDARFVFLPIYDEPSDGRYLMHMGGSYSYRSTAPNNVRFSTKPELGLLSAGFLSTTVTGDTDYNQFGAEFLAIWGPFMIQSEAFLADANPANQFNGGYVQASYMLTGENRGYRRDDKVITGVKPFEDFFRVSTADGVCMGSGAWELAARYSFVDLNEGTATVLPGGVLSTGYENSYTLGVNWYWNPSTRMMFDYVWEVVHRTNGLSDGLGSAGMRWQINF